MLGAIRNSSILLDANIGATEFCLFVSYLSQELWYLIVALSENLKETPDVRSLW